MCLYLENVLALLSRKTMVNLRQLYFKSSSEFLKIKDMFTICEVVMHHNIIYFKNQAPLKFSQTPTHFYYILRTFYTLHVGLTRENMATRHET